MEPLITINEMWNDCREKLLFPIPRRSPYYISAPRWAYHSAGGRALHLLCHALNRAGEEAYITNHPFGEYLAPWSSPELMVEVLSKKRAKRHFLEGRTPIIVYPEVITGNPLGGPVVARWVLNFPGFLGGDLEYAPEELVFGYSAEIAESAKVPGQVLHMPTIDTRIFYPPENHSERKGACFFSSKYKGPHSAITNNCFHITRFQSDSLTPQELSNILRKSEVFYTYENTALATEAVLCGCPAVFIPNEFLVKRIGECELGKEGYAWGIECLDFARATVGMGIKNYIKTYDYFWNQLKVFIQITQKEAHKMPYSTMINIPFDQRLFLNRKPRIIPKFQTVLSKMFNK